jgi:hypothetical protein
MNGKFGSEAGPELFRDIRLVDSLRDDRSPRKARSRRLVEQGPEQARALGGVDSKDSNLE